MTTLWGSDHPNALLVCEVVRLSELSLQDSPPVAAHEIPQSNQSRPVCPACLAATKLGTHICPHCNTPLSTHATTDPLLRIHAMGRGLRNATSRPRSRVVIVGAWLLFGGLFLLNLPAAWYSGIGVLAAMGLLPGVQSGAGIVAMLFVFLLALGMEALCVAVLYRVTKNGVARERSS